MPVWATEQYPDGLGPTTAGVAELIPDRPAKTTFHCCAVPQLLEQLYGRNVRHVTVAGIEAHVCVAQTALELLDLGFRVQVPADAVASRHKIDWEFGLRRLEHAGAVVSTTEAVIFEWTETADRPEFKAISHLIKVMNRPAAQWNLSVSVVNSGENPALIASLEGVDSWPPCRSRRLPAHCTSPNVYSWARPQ